MFLQPPNDGWTNWEKIMLKDTLLSIYKSIPNSVDRFIFLAKMEVGYSETDIAYIFKISQPAVNKRLKKILAEIRKNKKNFI